MYSFLLRDKQLLPIIQGGMGVGISAHRLAGTVASYGAMGTISSVDLRRHHEDLMAPAPKAQNKEERKRDINHRNLIALDREIRAAKELSQGRGAIAVNVMKAVTPYPEYVRQACESGADAIVVGAGLPLDLPDLTKDYPDVALIPILSDARGVRIVLRRWARNKVQPDAIVIENPNYAAGHLGVTDAKEIHSEFYAFAHVITEVRSVLEQLKIDPDSIPIIAAGGVHKPEQIKELLSLGASAVQLGSAFAVTQECDAHENFKKVMVDAQPEDIVTFNSVVGIPARAVRTPWLDAYLHKEEKLQSVATERDCTEGWDCLTFCGLRDGVAKAGQFCINRQLAYALKGDVQRGLFFRSSEPLPFGSAIRSVSELLEYLLSALPFKGQSMLAAAT
ncbi:MAG TPA: nitronate monooxygenase family protein [Paenalcaligenes sp.]|nr:nitronate monooxygenase family protein [Paenalcaligenes sp.]